MSRSDGGKTRRDGGGGESRQTMPYNTSSYRLRAGTRALARGAVGSWNDSNEWSVLPFAAVAHRNPLADSAPVAGDLHQSPVLPFVINERERTRTGRGLVVGAVSRKLKSSRGASWLRSQAACLYERASANRQRQRRECCNITQAGTPRPERTNA